MRRRQLRLDEDLVWEASDEIDYVVHDLQSQSADGRNFSLWNSVPLRSRP